MHNITITTKKFITYFVLEYQDNEMCKMKVLAELLS